MGLLLDPGTPQLDSPEAAAVTAAIVGNNAISGEPTGFRNPSAAIVTAVPGDRTITLTGDTEAYYNGQRIAALVPGWVSPAHAANSAVNLFLGYDGTTFAWGTSWNGRMPIAIGVSNGTTILFYLRECHGLTMDAPTHLHLHSTIGTYKKSGTTISGIQLASTTAANRRPAVSETVLADEDLDTTLPQLAAGSYTRLALTGSAIDAFTTGEAEIIPVTGNQAFYNLNTGGVWSQASAGSNGHTSVWLFAVPVTADTQSQAYRYVWVQGQSIGDLNSQLALTPSSLNLGQLLSASAELICVSQIIVRNQASNWHVVQVRDIIGTRSSQLSILAGNFAPATHPTDPTAHPYTVMTGAFTAVAGGRYQTEGTFGVADPLDPAVNQQYEVLIGSGAATIGGVAHLPSRLPVVRRYDGAAWATLPAVATGGLTVDGTPFSSDFSNVFTAHPTAGIKLPASTIISSTRNINTEFSMVKMVSAVSNPNPAFSVGEYLYCLPSTTTYGARAVFATDNATPWYLFSDGSFLYLSLSTTDTVNCFKSAYQGQFNAGVMTGQGSCSGTVTVSACPLYGNSILFSIALNGVHTNAGNAFVLMSGSALLSGIFFGTIPNGANRFDISMVGARPGTATGTTCRAWLYVANLTTGVSYAWFVSNISLPTLRITKLLSEISTSQNDTIILNVCYANINNVAANGNGTYVSGSALVLTFY
jgi:hypothetical protein